MLSPHLPTPSPRLRALNTQALLAQHSGLWRAAHLGHSTQPCWPSGFAALDAELPGGGWPTQALSELLQAQPGEAELRLLAPALAASSGGSGSKPLLLINPPHEPHALPGLGERELLWLQPSSVAQALWSAEQALASNAVVVVAWLERADAAQLRRLQAAAQHCSSPAFVLRPLGCAAQSSPAPLRLSLACAGPGMLQLQLLKRRGPPCAQPLWLQAWPGALQQQLSPRQQGAATAPPPTPAPLAQPRVDARRAHASAAR
ncbi:translesion DNA synthesis-associated protein ImuA [Roseateles sp. BYS180W]|uniref:Translesion DNA synthesis-associated protein ImuA n=1 Tax=Roseateles rivi TaxID=3299028 RepID=A0ABW7FWB2_9BURK